MGHKVHKDVRRKLANVDNKKASKGATKISDLEGNEFSQPINLDRLKKYYI